MFLFVPNTIPAKISPDNRKIEPTIPNKGMVNPDIRINPKAEPVRSALYTLAASDGSSETIVSSLIRCPVISAGINDDSIKTNSEGIVSFKVRRLL